MTLLIFDCGKKHISASTATCIYFILGPVDIPGNEIADELARSTPVSAPLFSLLSRLDLLTDHRNSHTQSWTTHFTDDINHHSDYFHIQTSLPNKPWFVNFPSHPRRVIVPFVGCALVITVFQPPSPVSYQKSRPTPFIPPLSRSLLQIRFSSSAQNYRPI